VISGDARLKNGPSVSEPISMADTRTTEVLVIGAGPGGYEAAIRAAQLGKKVLVIERENLGGVCLNVGCIPSKALIHAAKRVVEIRHAADLGITTGPVSVDVKKLQAWKRGVVDGLTGGIAQLFKANKVDWIQGTATFTAKDAVSVRGADGKETNVRFQNAIVATGSRPIEIPGFKFDRRTVIDSTGALDLEEAPKKLVVIGGGFIGLEIGQTMRRLGSEVTVVEAMDQILPGQDPDLVRVLARALQKEGIRILTGAKAKGLEPQKDGSVQVVIEAKGAEERLPADKVLVSVGRRPNTESLGLDKAGVKVTPKGLVETNDKAQTSVATIYAIGDITPGPALAHKASKEGLTAAAVIAGDKGAALDYRALPWAVFTDPEIATVGLTEAQAREKGLDPVVGRFPFAASGRAKSTQATDGFVKVVADKKTDLLLGVHIIGPEASNLIAEAALAIEMGATAHDLALTIHTHPTLPEALMEAAEGVHGRMIHAVNRS